MIKICDTLFVPPSTEDGEPEVFPGFYVISTEPLIELEDWEVPRDPPIPYFYGVMTYAYKFENEAEYLAIVGEESND